MTPRKIEPPDLQMLVATFGGWPNIPPAAWAQYDREVERWKQSVREGWAYQVKTIPAGAGYVKAADLAGQPPRREVIAAVRHGDDGRLYCEFQSYAILELSVPQLRGLSSAWGKDTDTWAGREVELTAGQNKNVLLRIVQARAA